MAKKKSVIKDKFVKLPRRRLYGTGKIRILGLDCSSTTVGWGLITLNKSGPSLVAYGHIKPLKGKHSLLEKLDDVHRRIANLCSDLSPSHIAIEDILLYMKGKSGAKTITTLAVFNRIIGLSAYQNSEAKIKFYSVQTIRKMIRDACDGTTDRISKKDLPHIIRTWLEPGFEDAVNSKGAVEGETYDEGDAIAAAWCCGLDLMKQGMSK